jgi:hypothetical protein
VVNATHSDPVKKPRQHYVWQEYLRSWAVNGKVHCLREGRVFATGTAVLGVETDFYKVHAITDQDLALLRLVAGLKTLHPLQREFTESFLDRVLSPTLFVSQYREELTNISDVDEAEVLEDVRAGLSN